jgi:hypothetical protein
MSRRPPVLAALPAAVVALFLIVGAAAAKGDAEVRLDAAIDPRATPGSTIDVGFSVTIPTSSGDIPMQGTPIVLRFVPVEPGAEPVEAIGREEPAWSGHYVVELVVPAGGIRAVEAAIYGASCTADAGCTRYDIPLTIVGEVLAASAAGAAEAAAPAVAPADGTSTVATPRQPIAEPGPLGLLGLFGLLGAAGATAAIGAVAGLRQRRRAIPSAE